MDPIYVHWVLNLEPIIIFLSNETLDGTSIIRIRYATKFENESTNLTLVLFLPSKLVSVEENASMGIHSVRDRLCL